VLDSTKDFANTVNFSILND